jgi:hypothetical protein
MYKIYFFLDSFIHIRNFEQVPMYLATVVLGYRVIFTAKITKLIVTSCFWLWRYTQHVNALKPFRFETNMFQKQRKHNKQKIQCFVDDYDWLIIYCFTSRSRIFHLYGDVTITGEGLQNLGLDDRRSGPLSRKRSLSCHTCCDTGRRFFRSHSKDRPIQSPLTTHKGWCGGSILTRILTGPRSVVFYDTQGDVEDLF